MKIVAECQLHVLEGFWIRVIRLSPGLDLDPLEIIDPTHQKNRIQIRAFTESESGSFSKKW